MASCAGEGHGACHQAALPPRTCQLKSPAPVHTSLVPAAHLVRPGILKEGGRASCSPVSLGPYHQQACTDMGCKQVTAIMASSLGKQHGNCWTCPVSLGCRRVAATAAASLVKGCRACQPATLFEPAGLSLLPALLPEPAALYGKSSWQGLPGKLRNLRQSPLAQELQSPSCRLTSQGMEE